MNDMKSSIYSSVTDAVASAKGAYGRYIKLTLNERQEILEGVKKALRPLANELAAMTVAETGMGILLVTHNMEDAARLAQRLLVLDQGQLLLDGSPQQIFQEEGTLLKSCGLEPPGVTKLMGALTQAGLPLKASQAVTPKEAAQEIAAILRKQGGQVHVE